jgi:predicted RND superfamily exporter protein
MPREQKRWVTILTRLAIEKTRWTLLGVGMITVVCLGLAGQLQMRMNWTDLLPGDDPIVQNYRDVQDRFGEASVVVALEGERDAIVAMAEELTPRLEQIESLHNVWGRLPVEFVRDHGFVLLKPEQFDRALRTFEDYTLTGTLRGINDDYEREYVDSESNMRRDEVEIARNVLGLTRALELLAAGVTVEDGAPYMVEAVDALTIGEPWSLSLDRTMLLIAVTPNAPITDVEVTLQAVEEVEAVMNEVGASHPGVYASTTGIGKISQDEMNSIGTYTIVLSFIALVLIYLLLSRTLRGYVMPLLALTPLLVGILWTMGALWLLFGSLNLFTAMMMLVLLGLGVDFSIHLISRFLEETRREVALEEAVAVMLSGTGAAVTMGGVTTALAFFTLMVGETEGVYEFGVAAGLGVMLTLVAIFLTLPALLVLRYRRLQKRGAEHPSVELTVEGASNHLAKESYGWIGSVAAAGWRRPGLFLAVTILLAGGAIWGVFHTAFEYDWMELEPAGLRSVELQREIPRRFGISDHAAWLVTESIEESRELKEEFRRQPEVGEVNAISDYMPSVERLAVYTPKLEAFRTGVLSHNRTPWRRGDGRALAVEIDRLWDNLDLMSNLAFTAGLDRIVTVIDNMTGVDSETGETDQGALLPTLSHALSGSVDESRIEPLARVWAQRLRANLGGLSNPAPIALEELPLSVTRSFMPKEGEGYLVHLVPRKYLWERQALERFAAQTEAVDENVVGTEQLMIVMMDATLQDGEGAALLALAVIALLLLVHFGALAMLGLMYVLGMKYNYMNLIATPIILGIGIDDGVHALHRYREQGGAGMARVSDSFRFVGKAILLTSLTTMIGFGSVAFYEMRGMASFGQVLFMGVGTCFLATVFVLPPVMRLVIGRQQHNEVG